MEYFLAKLEARDSSQDLVRLAMSDLGQQRWFSLDGLFEEESWEENLLSPKSLIV